MNAHVESNFGSADNCMRTYRGMTAENMSGMVQQGRMHDFDMPLNVAHDRGARKSDASALEQCGGFFWRTSTLTDELRASLVSAVRKRRRWRGWQGARRCWRTTPPS